MINKQQIDISLLSFPLLVNVISLQTTLCFGGKISIHRALTLSRHPVQPPAHVRELGCRELIPFAPGVRMCSDIGS